VRGSLVPDGRLDLCKQVVGPEGVGPLCEALALPPQFKTLQMKSNNDDDDDLKSEGVEKLQNNTESEETLTNENSTSTSSSKEIKRFVRGSLVPDGRLDLCKQVVGPEGVGPLCEALALPPQFKTLQMKSTSSSSSSIKNEQQEDEMLFPKLQSSQQQKEDLKEDKVKNGDKDFTVTKLLLGNNIVGNGGAEAIAKLIKSGRSTITTWYIAGNRIDGEGLKPIADALAHDTQVDMLWLKRNPLKFLGAQVISKLLYTNQYIHTLDLDNTGLLDEGAILILKSLNHHGQGKSALKHLYLNGNGLGIKTAKVIGEILSNNVLNFDSDYEIHEFNKIFNHTDENSDNSNSENSSSRNPSNLVLELSDFELFHSDDFDNQRNHFYQKNHISQKRNVQNSENVQNVQNDQNENENDEIHHACPLHSLLLGVNRFGDEGAYYIAKGLSLNNKIKKLGLSSNRIGILGSKYIAKSLFLHVSLESFSLGFNKSTAALGELGNYIQDQGSKYISQSLYYNNVLRELDLTQNGLYQKGVDYFIQVLREPIQNSDVSSSSSSSSSSS